MLIHFNSCLSKCLRQSSARGRREGFTRMGVPTQACEIRDTRGHQMLPKGHQRMPKGTKRDPKWSQGAPKGAKRDPRGSKREPRGDQKASKSRLGRQGRFWMPKREHSLYRLGSIFCQFFDQKVDQKSMQKPMSKNMTFNQKATPKGC